MAGPGVFPDIADLYTGFNGAPQFLKLAGIPCARVPQGHRSFVGGFEGSRVPWSHYLIVPIGTPVVDFWSSPSQLLPNVNADVFRVPPTGVTFYWVYRVDLCFPNEPQAYLKAYCVRTGASPESP